ncbi:prophage endopeptidase tail family protein [Pseudalkalibacillus caeni]|uniref:Tail spike domain-containing protein n=1 Tax=Exobacillus caeni TaxID=2574798 RepID=A0A5R9F5G6_9BACL|nr:prophage endopeptidase tail family protein [Pseudalkalibacillus caeni]TLS37729.1 hypothetical protein FCL54_07860 [Pseudalkalibacillus caeni]
MKEPIYIFDPADNLLAVTTNYIEAPFEETVNEAVSFEFVLPGDDEDAAFVVGGNQVAFRDLEGRFRLFVIREPEDEDGEGGPVKRALCLPAMDELNDSLVEDIRPQDKTAAYTLPLILAGTRYQAGNIADLGVQSTNFYYISTMESLSKMIKVWGGEVVDRVEFNENGITGRFIDFVTRRGMDTGKRWEIDKDIENIRRSVRYYPKTALYGKGKSLETEAGGYTRKITFADVQRSIANGDLFDKPLGQEWVGDPEALQEHGLPAADGSVNHRFGMYEDSEEEDPEKLLDSTWASLQDAKNPIAEYEMSVSTFEGISGQEHELARIGDTGTAIDKNLNPAIVIEARVMKMKYDIGDPSDGEITLGNYIDLFEDDKRLDWVVNKVNDRGGLWDQGGGPITDSDFENITPGIPQKVDATGGFKNIMLMWEFISASYIAHYEVYGSEVAGFAPDPSNLLWRGKTSGFVHEAGNAKKWYYRVRAVNYHGVASDYSPEVSAQTARVLTDEILFGAVTAEKIADLAVEAEKLADSAVTATKIANLAVGTAAIANLAVTNAKLGLLAVKEGNIEDAAITRAKIGDLAVDDAKIANLDAAKLKAHTVIANDITFTGALSGATGTFAGTVSARELHVGSGSNQDASIALQTRDPSGLGYAKIHNTTGTNNVGQVVAGDVTIGYSTDISLKPTKNLLNFDVLASNASFSGKLVAKGEFQSKGPAFLDSTTYISGNTTIYRDGEALRIQGGSTGNAYARFAKGSKNIGYVGSPTTGNDDLYLYAYNSIVQLAGGCKIDTGGNDARWQANLYDYIYQQDADGRIYFYMGGNVKHSFNADGSKSGGSIEVEGQSYGMSPIDSPQVLLEYIEFDIPLTPEGTKVFIDSLWLKTVENYAVFPNKGEVIEEGSDYFIIAGEEGKYADCRIIGERIGYAGVWYDDMDAKVDNKEAAA